jgi:hypothetical protein
VCQILDRALGPDVGTVHTKQELRSLLKIHVDKNMIDMEVREDTKKSTRRARSHMPRLSEQAGHSRRSQANSSPWLPTCVRSA